MRAHPNRVATLRSVCDYHRSLRSILVAAVALLAGALPSSAELPVVAVEEDWELQVTKPDTSTNGPQITCVISPVENAQHLYAAFELNHRTQPQYEAGGMQLQLWRWEYLVSHQQAPADEMLHHESETVRWTQRMELADGKLWFEVINGTSTSWGNFGGQGYLKLSTVTFLQNLDGYSPQVSADASGIGYAANRVVELAIKRVRLYSAEGLIGTSTEPVVVRGNE